MITNELIIKGPIKEDEHSHMFSSSKYTRKPLDLSAYDYIEEEYFISTKANIYNLKDNKRVTIAENNNVTTRIIIRRHKDLAKRNNRVYVDIMNATNCYDIEDLWRRSYRYIMESGFSYVGITSKPCNVFSLKNFDYERYEELSFGSNEIVAMPSVIDNYHRIKGCEEGLIWDLLTNLGLWIKSDGKKLFTNDEKLYTYLSGQSQSGMYLNTYVNQFSDVINHYKHNLYDGYLSLVGGGLQRALNQNITDYKLMGICDYPINKISVPYIELNSEGDFTLFKTFGNLKRGYNATKEDDKRRYYEANASAHTDVSSPLVPNNDELAKAKCKRRILDGEIPNNLNDFPLDYIINAILENLHLWASKNIPAPIFKPIELKEEFKDRSSFILDEFGNTISELELALTMVPIAKYIGSSGGTDGIIEYFDKEKIKKLYKDKDDFLNKFKKAALVNLEKKIITKNDYERMLKDIMLKWEERYE